MMNFVRSRFFYLMITRASSSDEKYAFIFRSIAFDQEKFYNQNTTASVGVDLGKIRDLAIAGIKMDDREEIDKLMTIVSCNFVMRNSETGKLLESAPEPPPPLSLRSSLPATPARLGSISMALAGCSGAIKVKRLSSDEIQVLVDGERWEKGWERKMSKFRKRIMKESGIDAASTIGSSPALMLSVEKRNLSHSRMQRILASFLSIDSPESIMHAGMKDKVGVTRQTVSVCVSRRKSKEIISRVSALGGVVHSSGICRVVARCVGWGKPIKIGDLDGNDFEVVIRDVVDCKTGEGVTEEGLAKVRERFECEGGYEVLNYFGTQRVGNDDCDVEKFGYDSWMVGEDIIRGEWERAVCKMCAGRINVNGEDVDKSSSLCKFKEMFISSLRQSFENSSNLKVD